MSEPKFTKGEWVAAVCNNDEMMYSSYGVVIGANYTPVSTMNSKPDAHLIAAAPEMYVMLEKLSARLLGNKACLLYTSPSPRDS